MKKIIKIFLPILAFFIIFNPLTVKATETSSDQKVNLYLFWQKGCPHCADEKEFLIELAKEYPIRVYDYEIGYNIENQKLFQKVGKALEASTASIPFTIIGDKYIVGFGGEETTGKYIEELVKYNLETECPDLVGNVISEKEKEDQDCNYPKEEPQSIPETISFPIIGTVNIKNLSLPLITILIGVLDGFNPCAMWTLLFLISLLIGMSDKKKMWILGGAFILTSAAVYFLFLAAWLNLLLFIGFIATVRIIIGLVAIGGGIYNLREYKNNPEGTCKVTSNEKRKKTFEKLKEITQNKKFYMAVLGIILLAIAVNLVELVCSAGLPAVFTQILTLSHLPKWQYYLYLLLYILFFMLDDFIVFFVSMRALQITGISTKYSRFSHLIGGILMLIIGLLLILKPELLMFG